MPVIRPEVVEFAVFHVAVTHADVDATRQSRGGRDGPCSNAWFERCTRLEEAAALGGLFFPSYLIVYNIL